MLEATGQHVLPHSTACGSRAFTRATAAAARALPTTGPEDGASTAIATVLAAILTGELCINVKTGGVLYGEAERTPAGVVMLFVEVDASGVTPVVTQASCMSVLALHEAIRTGGIILRGEPM